MTRTERIAELIKQEVSAIIREKVSDPRIGFASITHVDVSPDLKNAKIFYSVFGDDAERKDTNDGLTSATHFIKGELGHVLMLRFVPDICFVYDKSIERGSRVLSIMNKLNKGEKCKTATTKSKKR